MHHKIGIWVDGAFSWVDDPSWNISVDFSSDALISHVVMQNDDLQIKITFNDFVDYEYDIFFRTAKLENQADETRDIRVFMHQVFQISRAGRADTALFVPDDNYILDYKGFNSLLISGQFKNGDKWDQFAVGNYGIEGKAGTFLDAEDGELSGNAVEHGGVDSVIRFKSSLQPHESTDIEYWIAAAETQADSEKLHEMIQDESVSKRKRLTEEYWHSWLATGSNVMHLLDKSYLEPVKKSLLVIKAHMDKRGGVIASCDSSIYNYGRDYYSYVWPRDGAYAIWPLIRLGYTEEPKKFFEFCRDVLKPEGYLMHKYQPDKAVGSTWHPTLQNHRKELAFQEDETAIVIYMLGEYYTYSNDQEFVLSMYESFIQPAANFMTAFVDEQTGLPHASYDLWEEKFSTHTYTTAVVYQALLTASDFAEQFGYIEDGQRWSHMAQQIKQNSDVFYDTERQAYRKSFLLNDDGSLQFDNTLDVSSFYGVMMFDCYTDPEKLHQTAKTIESTLLDSTPSGGAPRHENDGYFLDKRQYQGNPWFVTTLWMSQYYIRTKQYDRAQKYVDWTLSYALSSGVLSEQVDPETGTVLSVTPLVWSHAELINTMVDLSKK